MPRRPAGTAAIERLIDLRIEGFGPDGEGLGRVGGRSVEVPFTIPGEDVRIRLHRSPAGLVGELLEVLRPSPARVAPSCSHFGTAGSRRPCGGCTWQHIAYDAQLRFKSAIVQDRLDSVAAQMPAVRPTLAPDGEPWAYRHTAHFVFGAAGPPGRGLVMGHYARHSRDVVPVEECPAHAPDSNALAFALRDAFRQHRLDAADHGRGVLRGLSVRVPSSGGGIMATLVVTTDTDRRVRTATRRVVSGWTRDVSLHLNLHPNTETAQVLGHATRHVAGPSRLRQRVGGVTYLLSPTAFFQTNVAAAELLVAQVLAAVPAGSRVLDLYAGVGLFSLPLALHGCQVTAVEANRTAVEDGVASLRFNRIPPGRCRFIARSVESALHGGIRPDVVVLDPPRQGCSPDVLDGVFAELRAPLVVYVSCNPATLAQDLRVATAQGYTVHSVQPVDMFPHTAHIEVVTVLTR